MPYYEFCCENCGSFESWRPFDEASVPMNCPKCQIIVRRVYTTPGLVKTPRTLSQRIYKAEKSAFEPEVIKREYPASEEKKTSQHVHQSHGRPWQLEH